MRWTAAIENIQDTVNWYGSKVKAQQANTVGEEEEDMSKVIRNSFIVLALCLYPL